MDEIEQLLEETRIAVDEVDPLVYAAELIEREAKNSRYRTRKDIARLLWAAELVRRVAR